MNKYQRCDKEFMSLVLDMETVLQCRKTNNMLHV